MADTENLYRSEKSNLVFGPHQKWCEQRRTERSYVIFHTISGVIPKFKIQQIGTNILRMIRINLI